MALDLLAASHALGEVQLLPGGPLSDLAHARDRIVCHRAALDPHLDMMARTG
ncbi:hypothetical protein AB0I84_21030 [Streptomyces spectabilis]|uniref:hypothetical protein n=1 Tax=Streptomyces spectabilis TaxID=68270 RepID=UPI0033C9D3A9